MIFRSLIAIVGAAGLLSLVSFHTAQADVTIAAPSAAVAQQDSSVANTIDLPEPASWTMLILGFGAIGAAVRHGRAQRLRTVSIGKSIVASVQKRGR